MHVPDHLVGIAVLDHGPVHGRPDGLPVEVPIVHDARAERAQGVGPLHSQHGARVGVTEVMQAVVVRDCIASDPLVRLVGGDVGGRLPHDDRDLPLVVQEPASRGTHDVRAVCVQRTHRLLKIGRSGAELRAELGPPALVVQVYAHDLRRLHGSEMSSILSVHSTTVIGNQLFAPPRHRDGLAVKQDTSLLHCHSRCHPFDGCVLACPGPRPER